MHSHELGFEIPAGSGEAQIKINAPAQTAQFVATLSDGTTAVEESGEWVTRYGERKPWVRLTQFAAREGLHLTSLRLNIAGRTIHMPREKFDRFGLEGETPLYYSLSYHLEVDDAMMGQGKQSHFVALAAHFDEFTVNYIQDVSLANTSWIVVTKGEGSPLVPSPRKK